MKNDVRIVFAVALLLFTACRREAQVDPLRRSYADGLNKEAFVNRYRDPAQCIALSDSALRYIEDSLPTYTDGRLRAYNNKAFAYYQQSDRDGANGMLDLVESTVAEGQPATPNSDIEHVIAQLLRARLLQRNCQIADSYRLLYDIESSHVLERNRGHLLYSYAQSEYYITMLVLSYHYRDGQEADVRSLLEEVESQRDRLKVDYAQDMALNYALSYGWQSAGESDIALDYCDDNFRLLDLDTSLFCLYHYANTLQMTAWALKTQPGLVPPDSVLALYDSARVAFFHYGDPYQMLGGTISTARYALLIGDTLRAHKVLNEWRAMRGTWKPFAAPKMELGYFDVMIRSRIAKNADEDLRWYVHQAELQEHIKQSEQEDFALQQTLTAATRRSRWMTHTAMGFGVLALLLMILTVLLWRNALRLRREKQQLEEAKRRDVERIANVETCLSVMRHDINPFISYLRSPTLSPELRSEVLEQLLRTFENIKKWTHLSIPSGLTFSLTEFPLQTVFDEVRRQLISPAAGVSLVFEPTRLYVSGDRLLVTILLRNLVTNALQHTTEGSVRVECREMRNERGEGFVEIIVSDTGSGMTAEQRESLFRADKGIEGEHGFGLILCRYIIKKHDDLTRRGCKLWVESEPGKGTKMHVVLSS